MKIQEEINKLIIKTMGKTLGTADIGEILALRKKHSYSGGDVVTFEVADGPKGQSAKNVKKS